MRPYEKLLTDNLPNEVSARTLSDGKSVWAVYIHGGRVLEGYSPQYAVYSKKRNTALQFELPAGQYAVQWWSPRDGASGEWEPFHHGGGSGVLQTPEYTEDVAAIIRKR
jgi:hypothetical protein